MSVYVLSDPEQRRKASEGLSGSEVTYCGHPK